MKKTDPFFPGNPFYKTNGPGTLENLFRKVSGHTENQNAVRKHGGKAEALTPQRADRFHHTSVDRRSMEDRTENIRGTRGTRPAPHIPQCVRTFVEVCGRRVHSDRFRGNEKTKPFCGGGQGRICATMSRAWRHPDFQSGYIRRPRRTFRKSLISEGKILGPARAAARAPFRPSLGARVAFT